MRLRSHLVSSDDGLPGRYKVRLPHGHTVYEVRIDNEGTVTQVDGRMVYCNADLGLIVRGDGCPFHPAPE